jgi:hypothetical protein
MLSNPVGWVAGLMTALFVAGEAMMASSAIVMGAANDEE